jgi:DNA-directed RNA polymerase subunit E'
MFYEVKLKSHIRVPPNSFGLPIKESLLKEIKARYESYISKDIGIVVDIIDVDDVGEGVITPGDGAAYHHTIFRALVFRVDLQEVFIGKVRDITEFGAFITLGPIEGMVHVSQTMDDFVSFAKGKVLQGKESGRMLKVDDVVRARMIAISYKDMNNPKYGLTMRQNGLGKLDWSAEPAKAKGE